MSTKEDRIEELVSLYSVGAITQDELSELESYLEEDPETVGRLIQDNEEAASMLSFHADEVQPPPHIGEDVLKRIRIRKNLERESHKVPVLKRMQPLLYGAFGAAAAVILIFLFSGYFAGLFQGVDPSKLQRLSAKVNEQQNTITVLENELEDRQNQIAELSEETRDLNEKLAELNEAVDSKDERISDLLARLEKKNGEVNDLTAELESKDEKLAKFDDLIEYLRNPNVLVVDMSNLKSGLNSAGRVLWNKQKDSAIFYGINLPPVPQDKIYQLWAIVDSKPVSCGIFDVDQQGNGKIRISALKDSKNIQKFAVTLEPAGGVPAPTGEMYLAGGISDGI